MIHEIASRWVDDKDEPGVRLPLAGQLLSALGLNWGSRIDPDGTPHVRQLDGEAIPESVIEAHDG